MRPQAIGHGGVHLRLAADFENYRKRKEIYEGPCSVNEERFNRPQTSEMNLKKNRVKIGKYSSRDSESQFTAPITGLFYDTGDNYDLTSQTASFQNEKVWGS